MSRSRTLPLALLSLLLAAAPLAQAEHPPSDDRDRSGYEDRRGYDDRDQSGRDAPRNDDGYRAYRNLHDEVHEAVDRALGSDADRIRVSVRGRRVSLSGSVPNARARVIAHEAAHDVPGVLSVSMRGLYVSRYYGREP